ncbi:polyphosphate polymerase domain-containing protein [Leucobacter zeae]|nr:polyphosphate polymerase domain-containing protein [Leucobacter zeae]
MSALLTEALGGLAAVGLDELNARAELLTRVDRKYLVPVTAAVDGLEAMRGTARALDFGAARSPRYSSVYFDTPDRLSYRLAAQARRRRFKVRTRCYEDTGTAYLEMKTKGGRGATVKERMEIDPGDVARLTGAGGAYVSEALETIGYDPGLRDALRPALVTRYRRATLLLPDDSRATVDTDLEWIDPMGRSLTLPGFTILESKSAGRASAVDRWLWRRGIRPQSISKFGTGLAALHPELPGNKWHRLIEGPFAQAPRVSPAPSTRRLPIHRSTRTS